MAAATDAAGAAEPSSHGKPDSSEPLSKRSKCCDAELTWRDEWRPDWEVKLGERTYRLHAFLLARASTFFKSHIDVVNDCGPRRSDLSDVLPLACHSVFELILDFIYSANHIYSAGSASPEVPCCKALLLLKAADVLGISGLLERASACAAIAAEGSEAPLLLEQYVAFHIPGTDDGVAIRNIQVKLVQAFVDKFAVLVSEPRVRAALMRLPVEMIIDILAADNLFAPDEDEVFDFVAETLEHLSTKGQRDGPECDEVVKPLGDAIVAGECDRPLVEASPNSEAVSLLWKTVRIAHLSDNKIRQATLLAERLRCSEIVSSIFDMLITRSSLDVTPPTIIPPHRRVLPPGVNPPTSSEIDICFRQVGGKQWKRGDSITSRSKRVGSKVFRLMIYPRGTTSAQDGDVSAFVGVVPQPDWGEAWSVHLVCFSIECFPWDEGASCRTLHAHARQVLNMAKMDLGWLTFLPSADVQQYVSIDGYLFVRARITVAP